MTDQDAALDPDEAIIRKVVEMLGEHWQNVQVFVSRDDHRYSDDDDDDNGTIYNSGGLGNWFARIGQTKNWVARHEAIAPTDDA